jgi:hypothetical protein
MALSPNYGWAEPDNSSLVKNGAQDIRALGDAIDTSVWNVGYGQAGKNKFINADFRINQRNYTTGTTNGDFVCDRNRMFNGDGTVTATYQTFTLGAAPVAGYEARNYISIQSTGQTLTTANSRLAQDIESVRTFAGQTVTVSFFAKAATGTPKVAVELGQDFGTGGSPSSAVNTYAGQVTLTTSWARYSVSIAVPSISGKTLGTNGNDFLRCALWASAGSSFNSRTGSIGIQTNTIDFWGLQIEYGSKATPFQTASGGSPQAELAMCQRYYVRTTSSANLGRFAIGMADSTTTTTLIYNAPVSMRIVPTSVDYSSLQIHEPGNNVFNFTTLTVSSISNTTQFSLLTTGSTLLTLYRTDFLIGTSSSAYLGFNAEL